VSAFKRPPYPVRNGAKRPVGDQIVTLSRSKWRDAPATGWHAICLRAVTGRTSMDRTKKTSGKLGKPGGNAGGARKLEGEGSYSATRLYNKHLKNFIGAGKVPPAAAAARRAVEKEGDELRQAERKARSGPKAVSKKADRRV
jgi:hypothetical protein